MCEWDTYFGTERVIVYNEQPFRNERGKNSQQTCWIKKSVKNETILEIHVFVRGENLTGAASTVQCWPPTYQPFPSPRSQHPGDVTCSDQSGSDGRGDFSAIIWRGLLPRIPVYGRYRYRRKNEP